MTRPEYVVRAVGPAASLADATPVRYELSDSDSIFLSVHLVTYLYISLGDGVDTKRVSDALDSGLSETLAHLPLLAGRVFRDHNQRPYVKREALDKCELGIQYLDDSFPSYTNMHSQCFPLSILAGASLLPPGAQAPMHSSFGQRLEQGVPCCYVQANFFQGGVILASALHHYVADAWSCGKFWAALAENTKSAWAGRPVGVPRVFTDFDTDRSPYQRSPSETTDPSIATSRFMMEFLPSLRKPFRDGSIEKLRTRGTPVKDAVGLLLHIPQDKTRMLKTLCAPQPPLFVSTFDCISALLFRSVTRARLSTGRVAPDEEVGSIHTINVRNRVAEAREEYFGNAVVFSVVSPTPAADVAGEGGLQQAALAARRGTEQSNVQRLRDYAGFAFQLGLPKTMGLVATFQVTGVGQTSWQQMRLTEYDFGFGLPSAFRSPGICTDGGIILFPTLPGEGVVAWVGSNKECIEAMKQDAELTKYARVVGTEQTFR